MGELLLLFSKGQSAHGANLKGKVAINQAYTANTFRAY